MRSNMASTLLLLHCTRKITSQRTVQPGPKVNKGTSQGRKQGKIHERLSTIKSSSYKTKGNQLDEGVRVNAEQLMEPDCVFFLPCGTAQRVTGTHYRREVVVSPVDSAVEFSGVVTLRPTYDEFLKINTVNGSPIAVSGASFAGIDFVGLEGVKVVLDNFYFPAFSVLDSTGNKIGLSTLRQVDDFTKWGQNPSDGSWHRGYVSEVDSLCLTSDNANFSNLVYHQDGVTSNQACTIYVGQIDEAGNFVYSASAASGVGNTTGAFPSLTGTNGIATTYAIKATTDQLGETLQIRARIGSIDLTNFDPVDYLLEPQVGTDKVYSVLKEENTGHRMSAASLLCGFRGSDMNNAGIIGVARVPEGTPIPSGGAKAVYDWISALPYDNYTGPVKNGGHTFWMPKTLTDIKFKKRSDRLEESNMLVIAFVVPGSTAGQITQFSIVAKSTWEWIYASQSMPQFIAPPGWNYLEALYAVLGQYNPSGENPDHMRKIKTIAQKIASNPAVRELASRALQLSVQAAKKALPALIAGVAL